MSNSIPGLRILIVEDGQDSADSMAMLLQYYGHDVQVAADGLSALQLEQIHQPDVILLDIGLPGRLDGWEVAQRLKQRNRPRSPFIIAVTGFGESEAVRHSAEAGIDLHLTKPTDPDKLRQLLSGLRCDGSPPLPH